MRYRSALAAVLLLATVAPLAAQNRGDGSQTGDGSTPFTGLAQAPEASMFIGAATTSIPIAVPPGRKNVTPQLALTYNSNGGPSPYGYGWDLPLPHVQRASKTGLLSCTDTVARQEFVLNMPGATIECTRQSNGRCIPHVEEAFVRITSDPVSTNTWTVFDRGGTQYTFGSDNTASLDGGASFTATARTGSDTVHDFLNCGYTDSWALTSIVDPNGNRLDIRYLLVQGILYPYTIQYGGNGSLAHQFKVAFHWEDRADHLENGNSGTLAVLAQRLHQIDVQYLPPAAPVQTVRSYVLSYAAGRVGRQTFLESVLLAGSNGSVLSRQDGQPAAPTFVYHAKAMGFDGSAQNPPAPSFRQPYTDQGWEDAHNGILRWTDQDDGTRRDVLDMNGDGIPDLVNTWPVHTQHDGCNNAGTPAAWDVYFGSKSGFSTTATSWSVPYNGLMCDTRRSGSPNTQNTFMTTIDITGDGIPDFVDARQSPWTVYPGMYSSSSGWGFGAGRTWYADPSSSYPADIQVIFTGADVGNWSNGLVVRQDLIDMNGDGRPDLVQTPGHWYDPNYNIWTVWLNTGVGFGPAQSFTAHFPALSFRSTTSGKQGMVYGTFDINGDGLPDQVESSDYPSDQSQYQGWLVCLNSGHATDQCSNWYVPIVGQWSLISQVDDSNAQDLRRDLFDINGDGLPDVVDASGWTGVGTWHVFLNRGDGFEQTETAWAAPNPLIRQSSPGGGQTYKDTFEFDGDGMVDFVDFSGQVAYGVYHAADGAWVQNGAGVLDHDAGMRADLLVSSDNGLGSTTYLQYRPSTQWDNTGGDGVPDLPFTTWTVTEISRDDGMCNGACVNPGSAHEVGDLFSYSGGRYDPVGRAFRGFAVVARETLADPGTPHSIAYNYFAQAPAFSGKLTDSFTYDPTDYTLFEHTHTVWECADPVSGAGESCFPEPGLCTDPTTGATVACPAGSAADLWVRMHQVDVNSLGSADSAPKTTRTTNTTWHQCNGKFYGNVQDSSKGDSDGSVVFSTHTDYACLDDSTHYLVDRPTHVLTRSTTNAVLDEKWFFYDGLSFGQVGAHGNVGQTKSWLDQSSSGSPPSCAPVGPAAGTGGCATTLMGYDAFGNITITIDPLARTTTTTYDSDPANYGSATYIYPAVVSGPLGHSVSSTYDPACGQMLTQTLPYTGSTPPAQRTVHHYDAFCRPTGMWRPGESVSGIAHRSYQYLLGYPGVPSAIYTYNREPNAAGGTVLSAVLTDALGRVIEKKSQSEVNGSAANLAVASQYDSVGRITQQSVPFTWGPGAFNTYTDPSGTGQTNFVYDAIGRATRQTNPDGSQRVTDYSHAWQTTVLDECVQGGCPGSRTTQTHDALGHLTTRMQYDNGGSTLLAGTKFGYDEEGRLRTTTQATSAGTWNTATTVTTTYDSFGRKVQVDEPDSGPSASIGHWKYGYDLVGNLIYQDDPTTNQHLEYCYDTFNRVTKKYALTGDAYAATSCSASGAKASYTYNESQLFGLGQLASVTDEAGSYSVLAYDVLGRVLHEQRVIDPGNDATTADMQYAYDAGDHLTTITYPDGEVASYSYDGVGQVNSLVGSESYLINMTYDVFGRPLAVSHPNAVTDQRIYGGASTNYRLSQIRTTLGSTNPTTLLEYDYVSYDANGRLLTVNDPGPHGPGGIGDNGGRYVYDGLGRLTNAQGPQLGNRSYTPNITDNLTAKEGNTLTYSATHPHQAITYGGQSLFYDTDGNRNASIPRLASYGYDVEGHLLNVNSGQELFKYDYAGRRSIRTIGSAITRYYNKLFEADSDGTITKYYYAGPLLIASSHKSNAQFAAADANDAVRVAARSLFEPAAIVVRLSRGAQIGFVAMVCLASLAILVAPWRRRRVAGIRVRHSHALGAALLIAITLPWPIIFLPAPADAQCPGPTPIAAHYHFDHLGSTQLVTDPNGAVLESVRYTPYGEARARYNGSNTSVGFNELYRHEFGGYETDPNSGLQYAGARWYDPMLGMFQSHDPAGQFANPYTYTDWDPINRTDPTGALSLGWRIFLGILLGPLAATALDVSAHGGSVGDALKASAISFGEQGIPIGQSYGLKFIFGNRFGTPSAGDYAISLIPIGGTAYGAVKDFHHGNYASGATGAVLTIVELAFAIAGAVAASGGGGYSQSAQLDLVQSDFNVTIQNPFQQGFVAAVSYLGKILVHDVFAQIVGIAAKPFVFAWDLSEIGQSIWAGNLGTAAEQTLGLVAHAVFPTYGYYGGYGYGIDQFPTGFPFPLNQVDYASLTHDWNFNNYGWIRNVWTPNIPSLPPGPFGLIYGAAGTIPFFLTAPLVS